LVGKENFQLRSIILESILDLLNANGVSCCVITSLVSVYVVPQQMKAFVEFQADEFLYVVFNQFSMLGGSQICAMGIDEMLQSRCEICCDVLKSLGCEYFTALSDQGVSMMKPMSTRVILEREPAQFRILASLVRPVVGVPYEAWEG